MVTPSGTYGDALPRLDPLPKPGEDRRFVALAIEQPAVVPRNGERQQVTEDQEARGCVPCPCRRVVYPTEQFRFVRITSRGAEVLAELGRLDLAVTMGALGGTGVKSRRDRN